MIQFRVLALLLPLALADGASAREGLGFDAVVLGVVPMQDYKQTVSPGLGMLAGLELPVLSPLSFTVRGGGVAHFERKDNWRLQFPAFGGAKLTSKPTSLYIAGEAGPVMTRDIYKGDNPSRKSRSATPLAWGVGLGSAIDEHDLRISFHVWDADHPKETLTFAISLAVLYLGD